MADFKIPTYKRLKSLITKLGHQFFDEGDYNLNLIGIRTSDETANSFNDWLLVAYKQHGVELVQAFRITTDPGIYWRENPMHIEGTAWVKPGQYPGVWRIGRHQQKYPALVQSGAGLITVYRDADRDHQLDSDKEQTGHFGINLHRASATNASKQVGRWSAGCQVMACPFEFSMLMALVNKAGAVWGDRFTYTLIEEANL